MLDIGRSREPDLGVTWVHGNAPVLPFEDSTFDHAVAAFVINHVPTPRATICDVARVVAPGGSVSLAIWGAQPGDITTLWSAAMSADGVEPPAPERLPPQEDFERSSAGLAAMAQECGLKVELATTVSWTFVTDLFDLWQAPAHGIAGIGRAVAAQKPNVRMRMFDRYRAAAQAAARDEQLHLATEAILIVCRVPGAHHADERNAPS